MVYYIIFAILLCLSVMEFYSYIELRKKKLIIFWISLFFVLLSTIRTNIVGDYLDYKRAYDTMIDVGVPFWKIPYLPFETGYSLLMYLIKKLSRNFHFFLFIQACLVMGLQYTVVMYWCECFAVTTGRRRSYELTAYFICWALYMGHIFSIRNTLAIMICLYAVRYVHEEKRVKFVLSVLLAATIHISVLVFLAVYFMYWFNASFQTKVFGFVVGVALFGKFAEIMMGISLKILPVWAQMKVLDYLSAGLGYGSGIDDMRVIVFMLIKAIANIGVVLVILFVTDRYRKKKRRDLCHRAEYAYMTIYLAGAALQTVSSFINLALSRIATPYIYFQFPLFLVFLKTFDRTRWKSIAYAFLISYITLRFVVNLNIAIGSYIPFQTIWSQ